MYFDGNPGKLAMALREHPFTGVKGPAQSMSLLKGLFHRWLLPFMGHIPTSVDLTSRQKSNESNVTLLRNGSPGKADLYKLKDSLIYIASSRLAKATKLHSETLSPK